MKERKESDKISQVSYAGYLQKIYQAVFVRRKPERKDGINLAEIGRSVYKKKTWQASTTIESAIVLPICFLIIILIIQVGVTMFDKYSFSMTAQNWVRRQISTGNTRWQEGLQAEIDRHMIYPAPVVIQEQKNNRIQLRMEYAALLRVEPFTTWMFTTTISLPRDHKSKLYHYLNGRQLINRIPFLDNIQEKYFELLEKVKKD